MTAAMITPPGRLSFDQWVGAIQIEMTGDIIPFARTEDPVDGWRGWGNYVVGFGSFSAAGCPRTDGFKTWQEWGTRVFQCLNS